MFRGIQLLTVMLLASVVGSGCAPSKRELDPVTLTPVANPAGRTAAQVVEVKDVRDFSSDTSDSSVPSMNDPKEIPNAAIRSQTMGRFNRADVVLQKGTTVESIVSEAVANGLRAKGYTVVSRGPGGGSGVPVVVEIKKFWMWYITGFWTVEIRTEVQVKLRSPLTVSGMDETVAGTYSINSPVVTMGVGAATVDDALDDLSKNVQAKLRKP